MTYIHPRTDILTNEIGDETTIWQFCVILPNAKIGNNCNICAHVFIENDVVVGNNVTIKSGVQLWDGIVIEDNVFIGPNATFTNELIPRSKAHDPSKFKSTLIKKGASIGANATVLPGLVIGKYSFIGAGSVVTKNIPDHTLWYGNPATQKGYITEDGILLDMDKRDKDGVEHVIKSKTND